MLKIRLQRVGRKHEPRFRLVLTDSKNSTKSGKTIEILGNYDVRIGDGTSFNTEKIMYWIGKGAQVSDTVHNILVDKKVISGKKINVLPLKKPIVKEADTVEAKEAVVPKEDTEETPKEITEEKVEEKIEEKVEETAQVEETTEPVA